MLDYPASICYIISEILDMIYKKCEFEPNGISENNNLNIAHQNHIWFYGE